jgi:hypothetical protein
MCKGLKAGRKKKNICLLGEISDPKPSTLGQISIALPILLHPKPSPFFHQITKFNDKMKEENEDTLGEAKTLMADELWILANMG